MTLKQLFSDIAGAIRAKDGSTGTIKASAFSERIQAIVTGPDTSDATAGASDILSGKTAYVKGTKITGTISSKTADVLTVSGGTVNVPAGYYPSAVSKSVPAASQAAPNISVSSAGLITASATQAAGYVPSGTKSGTYQMSTQGAQTITPGTSNKTISSGRYLTGTQTIKGDSNLTAENIKSGVSIFGVSGTYSGSGSGTSGTALTLTVSHVLSANQAAPTKVTVTGPNGAVFSTSSPVNLSKSVTLTWKLTVYQYGEYTVTSNINKVGTTTEKATFSAGGSTSQTVTV